MNADVTIIVPAYINTVQGFEHLDSCLASCIDQAKVIVWNDGSSELLQPLIYKYAEARFLGGAHRGKGYSRNQAVSASRTMFIYPLDADDELMPGAIDQLTDAWDGTPLYSDIIKVHEGNTLETFSLPDFSCTGIAAHSLATVNVLHTKGQWKAIGGWSESINLLEDWVYNFKLFWKYCAKKIGAPLVRYRQHPEQSTKKATLQERQNAWMRAKVEIKEYQGRYIVAKGCCGQRRTNNRTLPSPSPQPATRVAANRVAALTSVSLEDDLTAMGDPGPGKVWARYLAGRGMGPHNRRGKSTRKVYQRVRYGNIYAVNAQDAITKESFEGGQPSGGFVALAQKAMPAAPPVVKEAPPVVKDAIRTPVIIKRVPMTDVAELVRYKKDMQDMSIRELNKLLNRVAFSAPDIADLLEAERMGKARIGAVKLLEKALNRLNV